MKRRPRRREDPELNLVPMIDVVLVLLIFFMIATSLRRESALELRLPESSGLPMPGNPATLEVSIDAEGGYAINGQALHPADAATLREQLKSLSGGRALPLTLRADGRTPHQAVVTVLDVAGQLGLQQLTIATESAPPAPESGP